MIYRTWFCLNRHCRHEYTVADVDNPPCPRCGEVRVRWIPGTTGVISSKTRAIDRTVAELKQTYGDQNYRSPVRGERAAPPTMPALVKGRTRRFAPAGGGGWSTELPTTADGRLYDGAFCGPSGVTAKLARQVGSAAAKVPVDKRAATVTGAIPKFEAVHRPPGGRL